jgi:hypothetical protein
MEKTVSTFHSCNEPKLHSDAATTPLKAHLFLPSSLILKTRQKVGAGAFSKKEIVENQLVKCVE